jgi:Gpi18-like mannosyltransferase
LVKEFHPEIDPYLPIIFLLIFPTAFFLNAVYTESLFLFLSLATFYYALKKNFFSAGIFGFFASLTRLASFASFYFANITA